jgi:hypothetical protein
MGSFKQTQLGLRAVSAFSLRPQLAVCALNPHLSRYAKTIEAGSILGIFFVGLACIFLFYFLNFLRFGFVSLFLDMSHLYISYFLGLCS